MTMTHSTKSVLSRKKWAVAMLIVAWGAIGFNGWLRWRDVALEIYPAPYLDEIVLNETLHSRMMELADWKNKTQNEVVEFLQNETLRNEVLKTIPKEQTFIVESPLFYTPKCAELEAWAKQNLPATSKTYSSYTFLRYDQAIMPNAPFLKHDYTATADDYQICRMNAKDRLCYICSDDE